MGGPAKNDVPSPGTATVLAAGTRAVGQMDSNEDLVLCGSFKGKLHVLRALRIMPEANFEGEIEAESILVMGRVDGTLQAVQRIEIRPGAAVSGEVITPQIRVHEGVILNANVRMSAVSGPSRHYLLPGLLKAYDSVPHEDLESAERAAEELLRPLGFELETRAQHADKRGILRPIFRSSEPLPYRKLREQLERVASILQSVATPGQAPSETEAPLQTTGASGARELAQALGRLRQAALVVGPVALTRFEDTPGAHRMAVYVRRDSLPEERAGEPPDPGQLLIALQKVQQELLTELNPRRS